MALSVPRCFFGNSFEEVQVRALFVLCYPDVNLC